MKTRPKLEAQAAPGWDHSCNIHTMPFTDTHTVKQLRQSLYMMSYKKGKKRIGFGAAQVAFPLVAVWRFTVQQTHAFTIVCLPAYTDVWQYVELSHDRVFASVYRRVGIRRAVTRSCVCQRIPTCGNT